MNAAAMSGIRSGSRARCTFHLVLTRLTAQLHLTPTYIDPILTPSLFQPGLDPLRTNLRTQFVRALALHRSPTTRNA